MMGFGLRMSLLQPGKLITLEQVRAMRFRLGLLMATVITTRLIGEMVMLRLGLLALLLIAMVRLEFIQLRLRADSLFFILLISRSC